jgi:hypothetical protein
MITFTRRPAWLVLTFLFTTLCCGAPLGLAGPFTGWDFEDGTLQGWSMASTSTIGPTGYSALAKWSATPSPTFWDPLGYNSQNPAYGFAAAPDPFADRSAPQDAPLVLRSPTFELHPGQIIANLLGGTPQADSVAPANFSDLSGPSIDTAAPAGSDTSYQGIALRRDSDGAYLLHKARTSNSSSFTGWQQMTFTEAELAPIIAANPGQLFTLDLIDTAHGTFSSLNLDTITVPVPAGQSLVSGGGTWNIHKRDTTAANFPNPGTTLATVDELFTLDSTDARVVGDYHGTASVIDMHGSGATGHFGGDAAYPGGNADRFAMKITGKINVLQAGDITFGFYSNDGARLMIDGTVVAEDNFVGDLAADVLGTINLSAGLHDVEFVMFDTTGSDTVELYVATTLGTYTSLNEASFELLTVVPEPASLALAGIALFGFAAVRRARNIAPQGGGNST